MRDPSSAQCVLLDGPTRPIGWRWDPDLGLGRPDGDPGQARCEPPRVISASQPPADQAAPPRLGNTTTVQMVSARFAHIVAETLDGRRRMTQLETWFDSASLGVLADQVSALKGSRVRLGSVRVQPLSESAAEVTLRWTTPRLNHAAALRVTQRGGHWFCTDLVMA